MMRMSVQNLARLAVLTALALVLGLIENWLAIAPGLPGVKLGLSNTVLLYALYLLDIRSALLLMFLKVVLSGLLFAGPVASLFGLGGGILSLAVMIVLKQLGGSKVSAVGVSIAGAVAHNLGQLMVAALVVRTAALLGYLPVLLVSAVLTGILTGSVAQLVMRNLRGLQETPIGREGIS